jgi:hypothetical protein
MVWFIFPATSEIISPNNTFFYHLTKTNFTTEGIFSYVILVTNPWQMASEIGWTLSNQQWLAVSRNSQYSFKGIILLIIKIL